MNISTIIIVWTLVFQLQKCFSSRVELNIEEKSGSKVKLICMPPNNMLVKTNETTNILGKDSKFGTSEQKKVILNDPDLLVISNSNEKAVRLKCLFKALKLKKNLGARSLDLSKDRKQRKLSAESANKSGIPKEIISREEPKTAGSIQTEEGNCPPGHRIDQDRCFPCFPGSYTSGQETECFLCPKDFYMSSEGADSCWPCPEGKSTLKEGADSESACIGVHEKSGFSLKWIILIILLALFLLFLWICIGYLLIRKYLGRDTIKHKIRRNEETEIQGLTKISTNKDHEQKNRVSTGKYKCKKHHRSIPHFRKQWKVDFKGSAILTDNNSSSNDEEDILDIQSRSKSTSEIHETDTVETQLQVENSDSLVLKMPDTLSETSNDKIGNSYYLAPTEILNEEANDKIGSSNFLPPTENSSQFQQGTSQVKDEHQEKLLSENVNFLTSTNSSNENTNESQEYQTCNSFSCISDDVLFNKRNITKPTSCPLHQEIVNRCHVEVMLIPFPPKCS